MTRVVKVRLDLESQPYVRGVGNAELATKKLDASIDELGRNNGLAKVESGAVRVRKGVRFMSESAKADLAEMGKHAGFLDNRIKEVQKDLVSLARGFANTGDPKFFAQIAERQQVLRKLTSMRRLLPSDEEQAKAGGAMGVRVGTSMAGQLRAILPGAVHPAAIGAGAAIAAAVSPLVGAAVSGALIGGAAIGAAGIGVAIASQDARVQQAARSMAAGITNQLRNAALPFIDATMDSLAVLEQGFNGVSGNIRSLLANAAVYLKPLASGVVDFLQPVIRGLDKLVASAGPVIEAIRRGLGDLGNEFGRLFSSLADNGEAAGMAISAVFNGLIYVVRTVGMVINGLTEAFGWLVNVADKLGFLTDEGKEKLNGMRAATDAASNSGKGASSSFTGFKAVIKQTGASAATTAVQFETMADASARITGTNLSAAEAAISLREAIRTASKAADGHKRVSDAESSALIAMARSTNSSTKALDEQGRSTVDATRAHEGNRKKLIEVAVRMGYTRTEAKRLASQYLATPKNVNTRINQPGMPGSQAQTKKYHGQLNALARQIRTNVSVHGDKAAYAKLKNLLVQQQALSKGISVSAASSAFRKQEAQAFSEGGYTGPGPKMRVAGVVHADEFVINKAARQRIERRSPGLLEEMNATGQVPAGYATGGRVINAPFRVNASITKIMSLAEALSKVTPAFGNWPSSPSAQRGDSGIWRGIVRMIRATGPMSGRFGNGYRPGDPKWHGSGRAVDWMGFNQDRLARFLAAKRPLELIHRTRNRDYAYTRGRNKGSFNQALMNAHRNHIHIAMAGGGVIREPVMGTGLRSGASYSFAERGPETVIPGTPGGIGKGSITYVINVAVSPLGHPAETGRQVVKAIQAYETGSGTNWRK
jgi:hypothetical protein